MIFPTVSLIKKVSVLMLLTYLNH